MTKVFRNDRGAVFAKLDGDVLIKNEKQEDRLKITGRTAHGIDVATLKEAYDAGARTLEVQERGNGERLRVFRISFDDLFRHGRGIFLAGRERWVIPLPACNLLSGEDEPWRLEARRKLLRDEANTGQTRLFGEVERA